MTDEPVALPSVDKLLDKLREHAARPEWNVSLDQGELLVLFDHLDALQHGAPEIHCPNCEATIRARLADMPGEDS